MKRIKLTSRPPSVARLLSMARKDVVIATTEEGESFVVSLADDFDTKVQFLRRDQQFLTMLDELKKEERTVAMEEAEKRLRWRESSTLPLSAMPVA